MIKSIPQVLDFPVNCQNPTENLEQFWRSRFAESVGWNLVRVDRGFTT